MVNVYGQLTKLSGQIVQTFEETLHKDIPAELLEKEINNVVALLEGSAHAARALPA